jgi:tripartite-type tricarboxylate transporter receptor subunit TctC
MNRTFKSLLTAFAVCIAGATSAQQTYPNKPITMVVAWPAGGAIDVAARILATELAKSLNQPVVVMNRAGAAGNIGAAAVAKAEPNGYTLLMTSAAIAVSAAMNTTQGYDFFKELKPVTIVGQIPFVLVTNTQVPAANLKDLVSYAHKNPGKLNFASTTKGTVLHLTGELFRQEAAVDIVDVPFVAGVQGVQELLAGRLDLMIEVVTNVRQHVQPGKLRMLAVATPSRLPAFPEVPTMAEAGLPKVDASTWPALFVPAGTPKEIVQMLNDRVTKIMKTEAVATRLAQIDVVPMGNSAEEAGAFVHSEVQKWNAVAKSAGLLK